MDEPFVTLSQAGLAELPSALELVRAYFDHDGLDFGASVEEAIGQLLADAGLGRFWFIELAGVRIGYLALTFGFDHEFGGRIGVVTDFFLVSSSRGRGAGARAMSLALSEARSLGLHAVELYVLDHNVRARVLYRRLGFEDVRGRSPMSMRL